MEIINTVPGLDELFNRVHPHLAVPLPVANVAQFVIPEALPQSPAIGSVPTHNSNNAIIWIVIIGGATLLFLYRKEIRDFIFRVPDAERTLE